MTVEQLGGIGEVIGALATVGTLVYLAVQIRANTRMMGAQSAHNSHQQQSRISLALAENQQLAGIFRRGLASFESLEPDEQIQFTFVIAELLANVEIVYKDVKAGISEQAAFRRSWASIRYLLASPGGRMFWEKYALRQGMADELRAFVDAELSADQHPDTNTLEALFRANPS